MCGLFGWSFSRQPKKVNMRALAVSLMLQNDNRGGDSWGWFAPKSNCKRVGIGSIGTMKRSVLAHMINEPVVIGHTRKATKGSVIKQNCHPFDVGPIVGAHNGIVYNHEELNRRFKRNCAVDSEHIFHHLAENEDLNDIEAYGAILVHSRTVPENPVFFGSFNNGDLAYCKVNGGIIWSSSKFHLRTALQLSGLSAEVEETKDGVLYSTVGTGNGIMEVGELNIDKPTYVSTVDWRTTGCSSFHNWRDEEEECGYTWDGIKGKFVPTQNEETVKYSSDEEEVVNDEEGVDLTTLTEKDLQELANATDSDFFSLVHLNEHFQEEKSEPIRLPYKGV